jgi:hypothetical protein
MLVTGREDSGEIPEAATAATSGHVMLLVDKLPIRYSDAAG